MKVTILLFGVLYLISCQNKDTKNNSITKAEMLEIVKACDAQFGVGVKTKDSALLVSIYSDSAQYIIYQRDFILGKIGIGNEWARFLREKDNPIDVVFNIYDVRGTREIIYETGTGYTLVADSTHWNFRYINVWRLQPDGSYKLEVDFSN